MLPDMDDTELTVSTASFFASHPIDSVSHYYSETLPVGFNTPLCSFNAAIQRN